MVDKEQTNKFQKSSNLRWLIIMFGIGLPEMILILALALIVVGPDKLPDLARSLAKGLMELKKTAEGLKQSLAEEGNPLADIKPDLEAAAKSFKRDLLDAPSSHEIEDGITGGVNPSAENAAKAYAELMQTTDNSVATAVVPPPPATLPESEGPDEATQTDPAELPDSPQETKPEKE